MRSPPFQAISKAFHNKLTGNVPGSIRRALLFRNKHEVKSHETHHCQNGQIHEVVVVRHRVKQINDRVSVDIQEIYQLLGALRIVHQLTKKKSFTRLLSTAQRKVSKHSSKAY